MKILWELLFCKPFDNLVVPSIRPIDNIRENSTTHHDKVRSAPERKEVRFDIRFEWVVAGK